MQRVTDLEKKYVLDVLSSQFKSSAGAKYMQLFEQSFAEKYGVKHAISCVNGTATLHAALEALDIGEGDEVIVPPLTMSATSFAVLQANATPIFADVDLDTFQICSRSIEKRISIKTKAIITVALYGLSPDMDSITKLAKQHDIKIIEDNAECFLGRYKGKLVGTFGDAASFSFQSSKHLTSGEGGIVITDDSELATKIRRVNSLGYAGVGASKAKISKLDIQSPSYERHVSMGWNYRMPELCCAVALAQTERMEELVGKRIQAAKLLKEAIEGSVDWLLPQVTPPDYVNSYWTLAAKNVNTDLSWESIRSLLLTNGGDGVYAAWKLTYQEPMFKSRNLLRRDRYLSSSTTENYRTGSCPNAELLQQQLFQFKTNYWNLKDATRQADILYKTLRSLNG